jgi:integrase
MDAAANSGTDPVGHDRETRLLTAFMIWCREVIPPRSKDSKASKPTSAYNMVAGVRRIHKRRNIAMVNCTQLTAVLKGLMSEHIAEHGCESLLPHRKEPLDAQHVRDMLNTPEGTALGRAIVNWKSPLFLSLGALFAVGIATGIRKAEGVTPNGRPLDQRRLRRSNLLWRIGGVSMADPTRAQLLNLLPGRDGAVIIPPPSKADQTGEIWGVHPIHLPYDPTDRANAATWLRDVELTLPVHGERRTSTALFVTDSALSTMHQSTVDTYLRRLLDLHLGAKAGNYSFHSFRIGFACALLAAGCDVYTIQALARWRSTESIRIYARMNPEVYSEWISKSLLQRASSTSTANLPVIDSSEALARLHAENYSEKADDDDDLA